MTERQLELIQRRIIADLNALAEAGLEGTSYFDSFHDMLSETEADLNQLRGVKEIPDLGTRARVCE